jgi:hypothetical protein
MIGEASDGVMKRLVAILSGSVRLCPEPEVLVIARQALLRTSGSKGHTNHGLASVALVRTFASMHPENVDELPKAEIEGCSSCPHRQI